MIVGKQQNHRDHDLALKTLLDTARKWNVWVNLDKLQYKKTEVNFFGETYTTSGCKAAQGKVSAITEMPAPTCKKEVQSFIGMINYLLKFSARLSELGKWIRELSKDKIPFTGVQNTKMLSNWWKKEIARAPLLAYYNPRKQTVLQTDANITGLGACLLQEEKPIYFASKALTEVQKGYVAIEIESLAVGWVMEKFHHFLYASHFILETGQKPQKAILSKKPQSSNPKTTKNSNKNLPIPLHCALYPRCHKSTCQLLVQIRRSEGCK